MNKKLLLIAERFAPDLGGVATSSKRIAEYFCELSVDVQVFSWTKSLPSGRLESQTIQSSTGNSIVCHRLGLFGNLDFSMQYSFNVFEWLFDQHNFDLVWGHYLFPSGFMAVTVAETFGKPSVVSARGNDIDRLMFPPGDFARLQWTLDRATHVTAVSAELAKKINVILGRDCDSTVLGNVVDVEQFRPQVDLKLDAKNEAFISCENPILGFCGELRQKKGLPVLLTTFEKLYESTGAKLMVIGYVRTRENNELSDFLADRPHLSNQVLVTGHLDRPLDVCRHINACDVMLSPSLWDGVPNSILESMACEKLVVASDAGGISEIVTHGETGFLVSKHELASFPDAVESVLLLTEDEKRRVQSNARKYCLELWQAKDHLKHLKKILDS